MDAATTYCPTRRLMETRSWALADRLSGLSSQLITLVGSHQHFAEMKGECLQLRTEFAELSRRLQSHRLAHRC
jgi:hypothetical protein